MDFVCDLLARSASDGPYQVSADLCLR